MKPIHFLLLVSCFLAFAKCTTKIEKLTNADLRHIESNTIVAQKRSVPLPYYNEPNTTVIYLVRHAEKKSDGSRDPELTQAGKQRASKLVKLLQGTQLDAVYSTKYKRTIMTAKPVAEIKRLDLIDYNPRELPAFAERLKKEHQGKRILVSGHSNTTPTLANLLIGNEVYQQINESDYSNFYVVCLSEGKETKYVKLKF